MRYVWYVHNNYNHSMSGSWDYAIIIEEEEEGEEGERKQQHHSS